MKKLLIYELNELPKDLLLDYIRLKPNSTLSDLYKEGTLKITETKDQGELHPWSTWPTFYRGVNNNLHKIQFINQDKTFAEKNFPPIWNILANNNISIGIFGSLQSYPPPDFENINFYLPDTFAPNSDAIPEILSSFQDFNLNIVGNNNAVTRGITFVDLKNFTKCLLKRLISPKTIFKVSTQISKELLLPRYKIRRSLMQPLLSFDPYLKQLKKFKPSFSTFFTNHLAGMMHRYWYDYYPRNFKNKVRKVSIFKKNSIIKALDIADRQIKTLILFAKENNYNLWIASSMGQSAIERGSYVKEIFLNEPQRLLKVLNLNSEDYKFMPSMYPDINIECKNQKANEEICSKIKLLVDSSNRQIITVRYKPESNSLNLMTNTSKKLIEDSYLFFKNNKIVLNDLGLELIERDIGTGYHIPEGILLTFGNESKDLLKNYEILDTTLIAPLILKYFNLKPKKYMKKVK
tara:strand:+ start:427 stop:1815 length:1389 start_codon:yes stop_codon:yes gene_type:complete